MLDGKTIPLIVDITTGTLVKAMDSATTVAPPTFRSSDNWSFDVRLVVPTRDAATPWEEVELDSSTDSLNVALGVVGYATGGTFYFTYNSITTSAIAYDATASAVETALNSHATISSEGDVTVTGQSGWWLAQWDTAGAVTGGLTGTPSGLYPDCRRIRFDVTTGAAGVKEAEVVWFYRKPFLIVDSWSNASAAAVTVTVVTTGSASVNEIVQIELDPVPEGGTYTLTFGGQTTQVIEYDSTAATIQSRLGELSSIGPNNVRVTGTFPKFFIEFIGALKLTNVGAVTASAAGLIVPEGLSGSGDVWTNPTLGGLEEETSLSCILEVQHLTVSSNRVRTLYRGSTTLYQTIAPDASGPY